LVDSRNILISCVGLTSMAQQLRLLGCGLPFPDKQDLRGYLFVIVEVKYPSSMTAAETSDKTSESSVTDSPYSAWFKYLKSEVIWST
jgi:hypothetical protein